jgi:RNA polymerase sigma-70 factor (ECF subfamily)
VSRVDVRQAITQAHHEEWARVVATLTRRFGDLDIAEEAAAEAFATAVERWPADGVPPNPGAWLTTTANRKAIDRIRREDKRGDKQQEAQLLYDDDPPEPLNAIDDERLRLIFTCCHPALAMETRVALTLRMVAGLTVPEIASAFLVQEATMGRRITRAKAKIKAARIPYRVPSAEDLPARHLWRTRRPLPRLQRGLPGDRPRHRSRTSRPDRRGDPAHSPDPCPHAGRR